MLCSWGEKAGMVREWVAGKTVWSPCYHRLYLSALPVSSSHSRALYKCPITLPTLTDVSLRNVGMRVVSVTACCSTCIFGFRKPSVQPARILTVIFPAAFRHNQLRFASTNTLQIFRSVTASVPGASSKLVERLSNWICDSFPSASSAMESTKETEFGINVA